MWTGRPSRAQAVAGALLLTVISGSLFVLVKSSLEYAGPLTIAALRYSLAAVILLPLLWRRGSLRKGWWTGLWKRLLLIGVGHFALGNVATFWGLMYVPATTASLMTALVPLLVLVGSLALLREIPTRLQVLGGGITLLGSALFFSPGVEPGEPLGIAIIGLGLLGNMTLSVLGRSVAREEGSDTLILTVIPLAVAGLVLLPIAYAVDGPPTMPLAGWALVLTVTLVNTAFAYLVYNHVLKTMTAFELSLILNLSPLVTAGWAWVLWGEVLVPVEVVGMIAVIGGIGLLQYRRSK